MKKQIKKIGLATVFFNPDQSSIDKFISFVNYGYIVAIANNGIQDIYLEKIDKIDGLIVVGNGENIGLAKAMNMSIEAILVNHPNVDSVALFDQDSDPELNLPFELHESYFSINKTENIACLGPVLIDKKSSTKQIRKNEIKVIDVMTIATSGTFISREKYYELGKLKDDFFIDCIDHEWCFRAKSLGMKVMLDQSLSMIHDMGEDGINWFGKYKPVYRNPIRHYYITRNTLAMLKLKYVPLLWKINESFKLIRRIVFYVIFSNKKIISINYIGHAFFDGVVGKMGKKN
jgi:rhamnosyltransferase